MESIKGRCRPGRRMVQAAWPAVQIGGRKIKAWFRLGGVCLMLAAGSFQPARAQTLAEWFSQKKTLLKYLATQIAALEQYGSYVRQGYAISQNGLGSIGNWAKGEFDLHGAYYSSRRRVNPVIRENARADACLVYARAIAELLRGLRTLDGAEVSRNYLTAVSAKVLADTDADVSELELVMTDGQADLSDDERLRRLEGIYARLKDRYAFCRGLNDQLRSWLLQRDQVLKEIETQRRIYELY